jgi:membrane-associated phospholipid phosphatase
METTGGTLLEPTTDERADDSSPPHPFRAALVVTIVGYLILTAVMFGIGLLLTHALDGTVGKWDLHVSEQFARHRTSSQNDVTKVATSGLNTLPVVIAAAVVVGFLALLRRWREAAFLTIALFLEITVFLSVTFVIDRPRPPVHRLNATPATGSFPSGHTAAATVLFLGIAIIVACLTPNLVARVLSALVAVAMAATVGFSRVYRGLHFPSDVFSGALLGLACLTVAALAVRAASRQAGLRRNALSAPPASRRHAAEGSGAPTGRVAGEYSG